MRLLGLTGSGEQLSVLCLGAHADDIEIGAGATILGWIERGVRLEVHWAVLSASGRRREEAHASAKAFLADTVRATIDVATLRDGFFPYHGAELKAWFEALKERVAPPWYLAIGAIMRNKVHGGSSWFSGIHSGDNPIRN